MAKDAGTLFEIRSVHWTRAMVMFLIRTDGLVLLSDDDASKSCSIQDSLTLNVPKMFYSQTIFEIESQKAQVHNNLQKKFSRTK